jgi:hypothetical protein
MVIGILKPDAGGLMLGVCGGGRWIGEWMGAWVHGRVRCFSYSRLPTPTITQSPP